MQQCEVEVEVWVGLWSVKGKRARSWACKFIKGCKSLRQFLGQKNVSSSSDSLLWDSGSMGKAGKGKGEGEGEGKAGTEAQVKSAASEWWCWRWWWCSWREEEQTR